MKYIFYIVNCFKFLCYLIAHKVRVYNEGKKIGLSLKRRLMHDMSKLRPSEFFRFVEIKYGPTPKNNGAYYKTYYKVLALHYSRNKHHPEYWMDKIPDSLYANSDKPVKVNMEDEIDIMEMCCDWYARSLQFNTNVMEFYHNHSKLRWVFSLRTSALIEKYLTLFRNNKKKIIN